MNTSHNQHAAPVSPLSPHTADDWENWEDDEAVTPIDPSEQVLVPAPLNTKTKRTSAINGVRSSKQSVSRLRRVRSRQRQKIQNAKAGLSLITDMTTFRRHNPVANQIRTPNGTIRPVKFVDAAALRALEGEPNSASVGNWGWLRKAKNLSPGSATPKSANKSPDQLTPGDRPIPIGISIPSDEASDRQDTPQTAATEFGQGPHLQLPLQPEPYSASPTTQEQQISVWSPDTPDTSCSANSFRPASSVYSQHTSVAAARRAPETDVPPVPALPPNYKKPKHQRLISLELEKEEDEDTSTPCTLFEEDGVPSPQNNVIAKGLAITPTPDSANSRSHGWWDHVVTPFLDKRLTFSSRKHKLESPAEAAEDDQRRSPLMKEKHEKISVFKALPVPVVKVQAPIVRVPTPRRTPTPRNDEAGESSAPSSRQPSPALKQDVVMENTTRVDSAPLAEQPPPYSSPRNKFTAPIKYKAVMPPGHPLHAQVPPSPALGSPGLAATMTSQGALPMADIPITPTVHSNSVLPSRPIGTYLPQEHFHEARGDMNRVERERRWHEKEEVVARKMGGFWRGRGCIPKTGCFGRTGAEGRKRRRVCLGVFAGILFLIAVAVALAVVLTRPRDAKEEQPSIWVNLTDYPPMPTGVMTVVGPDNTVLRNSCTEPTTLWSCSLPKDDHEANAPYKASQPTVIMQIQWDNGTQEAWKTPDGNVPESIKKRSAGGAALAGSIARRAGDTEFKPDPKPPSFEEMWFLGDTTDSVAADDKAGEPAPFYISILESVNQTVESSQLEKRSGMMARQDNQVGDTLLKDILPPPDLLDDGTPAPAVMLPKVVHQPVRLYDRGLPTERYSFYTHYKRTIFLKSTITNDTNDDDVPLDEDGGCRKNEADFLGTWTETRMLVQIWTKKLDETSLIGRGDGKPINGSEQLIRPGTMPYPVTVVLDTHGGNPKEKMVWQWPMNARQQVDEENPKLMPNNMKVAGTRVNPSSTGDAKFGGFDGGSGGCKCEWVNWV